MKRRQIFQIFSRGASGIVAAQFTSPSFKQIGLNDTGNGRIGINAGTAPTDTTVNGNAFDAVIFCDQADLKVKLLKRNADGTFATVVLG